MVNVYIAGVIVTVQTSDCGPWLWAAGVTACRSCWRRRLGMWLEGSHHHPATTDGNWQIKFHTEGHLLIRWGRGEALCDSPHSAQYTVVNLEGLSTLYTLILRHVCSLERVLVNIFIGSILNSLQRLRHWVSDWDTGYSHQRHWQTGWDLFFTRGFVHNILLLLCSAVFRLGASLINVSERKNLVSALMHSGFLHQWLWLQRYLPDTERYTMSKGGCWTYNIII